MNDRDDTTSEERRYIVAAVGTHGDVFPLLEIAKALRDTGAEVILASNESYAETAATLDLQFSVLAPDEEIDALLDDPRLWHPRLSAWLGSQWTRRHLSAQFDRLHALVEGHDGRTTLVAAPPVASARLLQELYQTPLASIYYTPWMLMSRHLPPAMTSGYTLPAGAPKWLARGYWWSLETTARVLTADALNRLRRRVGLRPIHGMFGWWTSPQLAIGLFPDWFAQRQPDWPEQLRLADFPTFQGVHTGSRDEVLQFCAAGEPPIFLTFGSGMRHAEALFQAAAEACQALRLRAVMLSRSPILRNAGLPDSIAVFPYAPLQEVLPAGCGVVHHGGIGTTAAALMAGAPQIIIPHAWDQLDNALRVERLGAGISLTKSKALGGGLREAITRMHGDIVDATAFRGRRKPQALSEAIQWIQALR